MCLAASELDRIARYEIRIYYIALPAGWKFLSCIIWYILYQSINQSILEESYTIHGLLNWPRDGLD